MCVLVSVPRSTAKKFARISIVWRISRSIFSRDAVYVNDDGKDGTSGGERGRRVGDDDDDDGVQLACTTTTTDTLTTLCLLNNKITQNILKGVN